MYRAKRKRAFVEENLSVRIWCCPFFPSNFFRLFCVFVRERRRRRSTTRRKAKHIQRTHTTRPRMSEGREKRERKAPVAVFQVETPTKKEFVIPVGKGTKLGDIPNSECGFFFLLLWHEDIAPPDFQKKKMIIFISSPPLFKPPDPAPLESLPLFPPPRTPRAREPAHGTRAHSRTD